MQNEKVIVIGAGAAGLYAAYSLKRRNVDFEILEASSRIGGRVKETRDFADFPIDLGAEWLHTEPEILQRMLLFGESFDHHRFETMTYAPKTYSTYSNGKTHKEKISKVYLQRMEVEARHLVRIPQHLYSTQGAKTRFRSRPW